MVKRGSYSSAGEILVAWNPFCYLALGFHCAHLSKAPKTAAKTLLHGTRTSSQTSPCVTDVRKQIHMQGQGSSPTMDAPFLSLLVWWPGQVA